MNTHHKLTRLALVLVLGAMVGCQRARVEQPITTTLAGNDASTQVEFWHTLANAPLTSNDDAFHALLLFMDGQDPAADYQGRVEALKSRALIHAKFDRPADEAIQRGTLAIALARMLRIKGGIAFRFLPYSPRFALRELQFMGLLPPSSEIQTLSGAQFVGVIGKIEDYQRHTRSAMPAKKLPGEIQNPETEPQRTL